MESVKFDYSKIYRFIGKEEVSVLYPQARQAQKSLENGTAKGNDFLGWVNLPVDITSDLLADIEKTAVEVKHGLKIGPDITIQQLQKDYDAVLITIGASTDKKLGLE